MYSATSSIEEEEAVQLEASGNAEAVVRPSVTLDYIFMNTQSDGPIGDVNVRKAVAYAFDYSAIPEAIYAMDPTNSVIPLGLPGAIEIPDAQRTDLDLAKEALAQSEWPDGGFELDYVFIGGFAPEETAGLILIESLQQLNITVNMIPKTWTEMVEMCGAVDSSPDLINIYTGAPYPDPYPFIYQSWGPTNVYDYNTCSWFFDPQVATLLEQASGESDEATRNELYAEIQEILWDARFGIVLGNAAHPEGRNLHWEPVEPMNPLFGYLDYVTIYEYTP
jgi:peptide/nickel transport system substrate-binding protein